MKWASTTVRGWPSSAPTRARFLTSFFGVSGSAGSWCRSTSGSSRRDRVHSRSTAELRCCCWTPIDDQSVASMEANRIRVVGAPTRRFLRTKPTECHRVLVGRRGHSHHDQLYEWVPRHGPRGCSSHTETLAQRRHLRLAHGRHGPRRLLHTLPMFHCNGWGMPYASRHGRHAGRAAQGRRRGDPAPSRGKASRSCAARRRGGSGTRRGGAGRRGPGVPGGAVRIVVAGAPPPTPMIERVE